ncbi:MAG: ParB/RepB/Spo0J family partition protein [Verrucomicrobia bacterium]|nr:ParB/RepB/Spo0J family partition protein [Verrucomicrobiota bacterium]
MKPKTVYDIDPNDVDFAPFNPRGETPRQIEEDPAFVQLKDSVYQYGVLVPIVVHRQKAQEKKPYCLVDGERRLRAALETGIKSIPARISTPEKPLDDVIQAFHIHMLRKQWDQIAQTRGLRKILRHKKWEGIERFSNDQMEELQSLTGCSDTQLRSLLRAAR